MNYTQTKKKRSNFSRNSGSANFSRGNKKRRASSILDPNKLIKKAAQINNVESQEIKKSTQTFTEMPMHQKLKANIATKGFTNPTQIQSETYEYLVAGRDLLGIANTGTGKTGAFLIPIIEQLLNSSRPFTTLVVVPTRELALQVEAEFKSLTKGLNLFSSSFIGGTSVGRDIAQLRKINHLIIGTPGRLIDLSDRGFLKLQEMSVLVLDEFDRMLDMGFINDIKKMVAKMNSRKQTMLFSATIDHDQKSMIDSLLTNPIEVKVSSGKTTSDQIDQDIIRVPQGSDKFSMLIDLIANDEFEKVLIFAETKRLVDKVSKRLTQSGVKTELIHGNKTQNYRVKALNKFKKGMVQVLVATDVAARGIDISDITHVINYEIPLNYDSYVHRIGRTGRAGKRGKAFTFVD